MRRPGCTDGARRCATVREIGLRQPPRRFVAHHLGRSDPHNTRTLASPLAGQLVPEVQRGGRRAGQTGSRGKGQIALLKSTSAYEGLTMDLSALGVEIDEFIAADLDEHVR